MLMCKDFQASNNARKLDMTPDDHLAVNQTYTHRRNYDIAVVFYA